MIILFACTTFIVHANILDVPDYKEEIDFYLKELKDSKFYSFNISWGQMTFIYKETEGYEWDSQIHDYNHYTSNIWVENENFIEVENKSYQAIDVNLSCDNYKDVINVNFTLSDFSLKKDEKYRVYVNLKGDLNDNYSDYTNIGRIIIIIE